MVCQKYGSFVERVGRSVYLVNSLRLRVVLYPRGWMKRY